MDSIKLSPQAQTLKPGIYEHFKGKKYQVVGLALHSETLEEMIIYKALYGQGLTWVRPLQMFLETVEVGGEKKPRFRFLRKL